MRPPTHSPRAARRYNASAALPLMFGLFKSSTESRAMRHVWPTIGDLRVAIPSEHVGFSYPFALQSATAFANLGIALRVLFQSECETNAKVLTEMISALLFQRIKAHKVEYVVTDILKLAEEQNSWKVAVGADPGITRCALSPILIPIWRQRLALCREDIRRGAEMVAKNNGRTAGYGIVGFVAKRWLSQISGRPIAHEDTLAEAGFDDLALASFYFNRVAVAIAHEFQS